MTEEQIDMIAALGKQFKLLTQWEKKFVANLASLPENAELTEQQAAKLEEIYSAVVR